MSHHLSASKRWRLNSGAYSGGKRRRWRKIFPALLLFKPFLCPFHPFLLPLFSFSKISLHFSSLPSGSSISRSFKSFCLYSFFFYPFFSPFPFFIFLVEAMGKLSQLVSTPEDIEALRRSTISLGMLRLGHARMVILPKIKGLEG